MCMLMVSTKYKLLKKYRIRLNKLILQLKLLPSSNYFHSSKNLVIHVIFSSCCVLIIYCMYYMQWIFFTLASLLANVYLRVKCGLFSMIFLMTFSIIIRVCDWLFQKLRNLRKQKAIIKDFYQRIRHQAMAQILQAVQRFYVLDLTFFLRI